jgi:hypothetical protein
LLRAYAVRVSLYADRSAIIRLARFLALGLRIPGARVDALQVIVDAI